MPFFAALLSGIVFQVPAPAPTAVTARLGPIEGRVLLVEGDSARVIAPHAPELDLSAAARLEIGAGARAHVCWPGWASLRLEGPLALDWDAADDAQALGWRLTGTGRAEIELRRGAARLQTGRDWIAHLAPGAFQLQSLPSGTARLRQLAGGPVTIERTVGASSAHRAEQARTPNGAWSQVVWPWPDDAHAQR